LSKAIEATNKAIEQTALDDKNELLNKDIETRKQAIKAALSSLDELVVLQGKLLNKLKTVFDEKQKAYVVQVKQTK